LTDELLRRHPQQIKSLTLIPSAGGRFEVVVNDSLIFSKADLGRHAEPGEVARLFAETTGFEPAEEGK
jgi:selenoprotein W-related protein